MFIRFKIFFILISISISVFGQNTKDSLVHKVYFYENGNRSSEGGLLNGKPEGLWRNYYPWGILKSEGNRVNYVLEGTWKFYNRWGDLERTIDYKNGKKDGLINTYSDSCYLILKEPMVQDVKHGIEISYFDEKGQKIKWKTPYKEGQKDGMSKEFDKSGLIITLISYRHGFIRNKEEINRSDRNGKQGTWKEFYKNGRLHKSMRYRDDILNGYYKEYDREGKLVTAILYVDGIPQEDEDLLNQLEVRRTYYENGQVKWEGGFTPEGLKQGAHTEFSERGEIDGTSIYHNDTLIAKGKMNEQGQRVGYWEEYYASGQIKGKGKYKDGVKIGDWVYYHFNGKIEQKGKYTREGLPQGKWVWYYENGDVLREENFYKGLEDGDFVEYNRTGEVITKGTFLEGRKDGYWFYELGDYREEGVYFEGRRQGIWKHYYKNGELLFTGQYIDGNPEGKHRYYYENGVLRREENYSVGEPDGIWRSYNDLGDLFLTTVYKEGKEYKLDNKKLKD